MGAGVVAAGIGAAGAIGSAAINSSSKGSGSSSLTSGSNNTSTSSSQIPWTPQGNALSAGFGQAQDVYNTRTAAGPYTGNLFNLEQQSGVNDAVQFKDYYANNADRQMIGDGTTLMNGATQPYLSNATTLAGGSSGYGRADQGTLGSLQGYGNGQQLALSGAAGNVSSALSDAATSGARALGTYNAGLTGAMGSALSDPTAQLSADAGAYMNSSPLQSQLANVHNQINSTLNEETNPGLNRTAAMGGNLNSSRAGMAEAMANRSAALAEGNADASILSNAWNTGLNTAASQRTAGLNTATSAANSGLAQNGNLAQGYLTQDTNSRLTAGNQALGQALGYQTLGANTQIAGNSQLGNAVTTGAGLTTAANTMSNANSDQMLKVGAAKDNSAYQSWALSNQYQQNLLNDYFNNVGKQSYGYTNTGTGTTTSNNSLLGTALGAASLGKALTSNNGSSGTGAISGALDQNTGTFTGTNGATYDTSQGVMNNGQYYPGDTFFNGNDTGIGGALSDAGSWISNQFS